MKLKGISDKGVKRLASTLQPTRASKDQFIHDMESDITKLLDAWRERLDKETSEGYPVDMYDSNDIVSGTLEMIENQLGLGLDLSDSVEPRALAEAVEEEFSKDNLGRRGSADWGPLQQLAFDMTNEVVAAWHERHDDTDLRFTQGHRDAIFWYVSDYLGDKDADQDAILADAIDVFVDTDVG